MKCETKAKRRATLSILGLGSFDETESESRSVPVKVLVEQPEIGEITPGVDPVEEQAQEYLARKVKLSPDEHEDLYREFLAKCPKGTSGAAFQAEITRLELLEACGRSNSAEELRGVAESLKTQIQRVKTKEPRLALWGVFVNTARELDLGEGEPEAWCKANIAPILNEKSRLFRELEKSITEKTKGYENLLDKQRDALCYPVGCAYTKRFVLETGELVQDPDTERARLFTVNWIACLSGQSYEDSAARLSRISLSYWSSKSHSSSANEET
jgi:hypothetical protein